MSSLSDQLIRVPADGSEPETGTEPADIHVSRVWSAAWRGTNVGLQTPAPWEDDGDSNELVKELPQDWWDWNEEADEWEVRIDYLNELVNHFNDAGYDVTVNIEVAREFESDGQVFLPEKR